MQFESLIAAVQTLVVLLCPVACPAMAFWQAGQAAHASASMGGCDCCHTRQVPGHRPGSTPDRGGKCCLCAGAVVESTHRHLETESANGLLTMDVPLSTGDSSLHGEGGGTSHSSSLHVVGPSASGRALRLQISSLTI